MVRCERCKYHQQSEHGATGGRCFRFPPIVHTNGEWQFPYTTNARWCGEFCPKDQNDLEMMMHLQDQHPDIYERVRRQIMGGKNEA